MQADPRYDDVVAEVATYLNDRAQAAMAAGVARDRIWLDPGIGFGKTLAHNMALTAHLQTLSGVTLTMPMTKGTPPSDATCDRPTNGGVWGLLAKA